MTRVTISDPSEGTTHSGYYSIEIEEFGELIADINLAPELVPDIDDPDELVEMLDVMKQTMETLQEVDDV